MALFFLTNPSYEKSLQAKYYYEIGDYHEAYKLANEAFVLDVYNRMASTIMAQSKTSMKYEKYIEQSKSYLREINDIIANDTIDEAKRSKIKLMSEVMVDSYIKLAPSVVTDKALVDEAARYHEQFEKILEKVDR
ncbi:hypothetical protein [Sulfurimonas sp. C5]|uniref:hypothetical protein n=1 Tax=Sulfurimonas sp. C5 TaxID=3036947 RepID=UPI0024549762|nr:hypothetical protein [Sulfurimonas sp. C5]MDH4945201.1 hypothetical protein [Sulfurimonas sp. C5]